MAAVKPSAGVAPTGHRWTFITSFVSDINLLTHSAGDGAPARAIHVVVAGSGGLVVVKPDGVTETLSSLSDGFQLAGQFQQITASGTSISKAIVYW